MSKTVAELQPGDVIRVRDVRFVIKQITNLPSGKTTIIFEDMDATPENMEAYGELLRIMKQTKEKEDAKNERTDELV